jgi:hypothetical protein
MPRSLKVLGRESMIFLDPPGGRPPIVGPAITDNCKAVPRTSDIWIGINRLRQMMPRLSFRVPQCEKGLEALQNYHTVRSTSSGLARDEPCHDWSSHACDALRLIAEAEASGMLSRAGISGRPANSRFACAPGSEARMTPGRDRAFWTDSSASQRAACGSSDERR